MVLIQAYIFLWHGLYWIGYWFTYVDKSILINTQGYIRVSE